MSARVNAADPAPGGFLAGVLMALGAAFFIGTVNAASKAALDAGAHPLPLSAAAYVLATLLFVPWLPRFRLMRVRDLGLLAVIILLGNVLAPLALFYGLQLSTAVTASLLINLELVFTAVLANAFLRERVTAREVAALLAIGVGAIVVGVGPDLAAGRGVRVENLAGVGLLALSSLAWSVDSTTSTPLSRRYDIVPLVALKTAGGAVLLVVASVMLTGRALPELTPLVASAIGYNGVLGIVGAILCFYGALRRVGATRTVVLFSTAALWGSLAGWRLLGEPLTWPHVVGGAGMIVGVAWLARIGHGMQVTTVPPEP